MKQSAARCNSTRKDINLLVRRNLVGLIALVLLGFAAVVCLYRPMAMYQAAALVGLRMGLVLGAFWLAWPDLHRLPRWVWFALPIGLLVVVYAKGVLVYAAPILIVATLGYLVFRRLRRSL
jgi:hypothetical protein